MLTLPLRWEYQPESIHAHETLREQHQSEGFAEAWASAVDSMMRQLMDFNPPAT
ncbi:MAG: hypothetical protein AAGF24_09595 [Cyanobacteria bacterium P01_H01_bin.121]